MTLTEQLTDYVNAAFSGLWVNTQEPDEAEREIVRIARERHWRLAVWDIAAGLRFPADSTNTASEAAAGEPLAALRAYRPWPIPRARPCSSFTSSTASSATPRSFRPPSPSSLPASSGARS